MRLTRVGKAKEDFLADVVKRRAEKDKSPEEDAKPKNTDCTGGRTGLSCDSSYGDAELPAAPVAAAPAGKVRMSFLHWKVNSSW